MVRSSSDTHLVPVKDTTSDPLLKPAKEVEEVRVPAPVITEDQEQSQSLLGGRNSGGEREVHIRRFLNTDI